MHNLLPFVLGLFFIAAIFRVDFFFYILYVFFGVYFFSRMWADRIVRDIVFERKFQRRAFLGERVPVRLRIRNRGFLPAPWLRVHERLPIQLKSPNFYRCVTSLFPREETTLTYELDCRRRGYYPIGPLLLTSGDLFGVHTRGKEVPNADAIIVYPRIVPLTELGLPAQTPFGVLPTRQRLYEDPTRIVGVREYQSGDSMRRIHWTATAATGLLQVKRFEPAISIESQIVLNLNRDDYTVHRAETATELGIVTAASIAHFLIEKQQTIGLSCSGIDPLSETSQPMALPPRKGREQLMRILELLARVQAGKGPSFVNLLRQTGLHLTWGGTGIVISPHADDQLFDSMLLLKRSGFHLVLILLDPREPFDGIRERAQQVGIRAYQVWEERDLDVWR